MTDYFLLLASLCVWIPIYWLLRPKRKRKRKEKRGQTLKVNPGAVVYPVAGKVYVWKIEEWRRLLAIERTLQTIAKKEADYQHRGDKSARDHEREIKHLLMTIADLTKRQNHDAENE